MHHSFNNHIFFLLCTDALPASPGHPDCLRLSDDVPENKTLATHGLCGTDLLRGIQFRITKRMFCMEHRSWPGREGPYPLWGPTGRCLMLRWSPVPPTISSARSIGPSVQRSIGPMQLRVVADSSLGTWRGE
jgi:hypothetical protein